VIPVRQWPLRVRFLIAFGTAVVVLAALVIYVNAHSRQAEGLPAAPNKSQAAQTQKEDRIVVQQQQAPHVVKFAQATPTLTAAARAVEGYMRNQTARDLISGPVVGPAHCTAGGGPAQRLLFHCQIKAGPSGQVLLYPFQGVVAPGARRVTYCQVITPPYPLSDVPLSAACR
jgi:hypothetical protein